MGFLIRNAKQEDSTATATPADVQVNFNFGALTVTGDITGTTTVAGVKGKVDFGTIYTKCNCTHIIDGKAHRLAFICTNLKDNARTTRRYIILRW